MLQGTTGRMAGSLETGTTNVPARLAVARASSSGQPRRRSLPMRLSLRFIIPLFLVLGAIAYAVVPLVDKLTLQWFERDLDSRASLVANTVQEPLETLVRAGNRAGMLEFFTRITQDERLYAMAFCPAGQGEAVATPTLPATIRCDELDSFSGPSGHLLRSRDGPLLVSVRQLAIQGARTVRRGDAIALWRPASGLVTAMEPIMRACSGTWIAHGGGSADREVVDEHDRVAVPPERPAYQLRRVWLTPEEEAGYYYGFANEGLWPVCHIAHVRPIFRTTDWEQYVAANRKFAQAVVEEAKSPDPIVLAQDYHFALLPRMIQESLPAATIVFFWHIPWPNPEAFAICPWREELLDGLLGSSILGFHTQFHCNNFVDTVDRLLEARVDREMFTVSYRGKLTAVKRYPISIEWPPSPALVGTPVEQCRREVRARHGLPADHAIGVGVDRLDYTKGIEERLRAVERLLEMEPQWIGKFTFIQIAAPTRNRILQYQEYEGRVRAMAAGINERFAGAPHPPIVLLVEHHQPHTIYEYYRAAEVCVVSSLHDGMNLVAKEFVSSRDDERGVLILSQFTGAARELPEAIIVNPYDTDKCAAARHMAL